MRAARFFFLLSGFLFVASAGFAAVQAQVDPAVTFFIVLGSGLAGVFFTLARFVEQLHKSGER